MAYGMPPGGAPAPPQAPPGGGLAGKMSMFNPADASLKMQQGDIRPDMTVDEFLQKNFGVTGRDPLMKLMQNVKSQGQNATMAGKMGQGQQPPQGRAMPPATAPPRPAPAPPTAGPARPPGPPGPQGPGGSLDDLINRI